jgi:hypothetical protein
LQPAAAGAIMSRRAPVEGNWSTEQALESLVALYGVDGGSFWRWTSFSNDEDANRDLAEPVKRRGVDLTYTPIKDLLVRLYSAP